MILFTATFHDDSSEAETDYHAPNWGEAVALAQSYLADLGEGWKLVSLAIESFEVESLQKAGHVVPVDAQHPEFGQ